MDVRLAYKVILTIAACFFCTSEIAQAEHDGRLGRVSSGQSSITVVIPEIAEVQSSAASYKISSEDKDTKESFCVAMNDMGMSYSVTAVTDPTKKIPTVLWSNGNGGSRQLVANKAYKVIKPKDNSINSLCNNGISSAYSVEDWQALPVKDRSVTFLFEPAV